MCASYYSSQGVVYSLCNLKYNIGLDVRVLTDCTDMYLHMLTLLMGGRGFVWWAEFGCVVFGLGKVEVP